MKVKCRVIILALYSEYAFSLHSTVRIPLFCFFNRHYLYGTVMRFGGRLGEDIFSEISTSRNIDACECVSNEYESVDEG